MDKVILRFVPAAGAAAAVAVLLWILYPRATVDWPTGVALLLIAAFGMAVAATLRFAVGQLAEGALPTTGDPNDALRARLAPIVIGIGTTGILVVFIAVLIAIAVHATPAPEPAVYVGIFSSVVPVLATWVGAVISFVFSNESFRQAAEVSGALTADRSDAEPITSPMRMIPLEKITAHILEGDPSQPVALEVPVGEIQQGAAAPANGVNQANLEQGEEPAPVSSPAPAKTPAPTWNEILAATRFAVIEAKFGATVSRVIVLDQDKRVRAIIRKKLKPASLAADATIKDYLDHEQNAADAVNFRMVPETATVGEGRAMLSLYRTADLFVTRSGLADEPIKGWVPDDKLQ